VKIKEKGQQFDDISDGEDGHVKTKQEKNRENQRKGEILYQ